MDTPTSTSYPPSPTPTPAPMTSPVTPTPAPPSPTPRSNKGIIAVLVIILLLLGGYLAWAMTSDSWPFAPSEPVATPTPSPSPTATADPTAEWKTYTNTQYGFEFKYPENKYSIQTGPSSIIIGAVAPALTIGIQKVPTADQIGCIENQTPLGTITVGGKIAQKCLLPNNTWQAGIGQVVADGVLILSFTCHDGGNPDCDQILATFKFTTPTVTTVTLKTYVNSEIGISIQHPSDWVVHVNSPEEAGQKGASIYSSQSNPYAMDPTGAEFISVYIDSRTDMEQIRSLYNGTGYYQEKITSYGGQKAYQYDDSREPTNIYIPYAGKIYLIKAAPKNAEYIQRSLATFTFTQ